MKSLLLAAVACLALISGARAQVVSVSPGVGSLTLAPALNGTGGAGTVIGAVGCVTDPPGGTCGAPATTLSGPDAARFALTNGSLTVGATVLDPGKYTVRLQRDTVEVPYTITVTGGTGTPPPGGFVIGQAVTTIAAANVRKTAAGTALGIQPAGASATVIGGPTVASLGGVSYTWWNLNFTSSVDGWVAGDNLKAAVVGGPPPPPPPPPPGTCADDDGSAGASAGTPNYPTLISAGNYKASPMGPHGNGCQTPGIDYATGVPQGLALKDPTAVAIPGCKYDGRQFLDCTNATIDGYDFTLHHTILTGSGKMVVSNIKTEFGANCADPVINVRGSLTLRHFTIDGAPGWNCSLSQGFGTFISVNPSSGDSVVIEYGDFIKVDQDGIDIAGPSSGSASVTIRFNAVNLEGHSGHPDWIQTCGNGAGVLTPVVVTHNLWYGNPANSNAGVQPIHIEAQICNGPGHIKDTIVANNVVLATGKCLQGQNWPKDCSVNFPIACKNDDPTSSNVNFRAYGNYIDWSGGITALTNGYGCGSNATFGTAQQPNWDMTSGTILGTAPARLAMSRAAPHAFAAALKADDVARKAKIKAQVARLKVLEAERKERLK